MSGVQIHLSINYLNSLIHSGLRGGVGGWLVPLLAVTGQEATWTGQQSITRPHGNIQTFTLMFTPTVNLDSLIYIICMLLNYGMKPTSTQCQ